jgi:flagellar hook-associated protein 3 FlgL
MRVIYDLFRDGLSAINDAADRLAVARQQVGTGRRLGAISDDPLAVRQAIAERATMSGVDAYTRTRDSAAARLAATDNILTGVIDKITSALVAGASARRTNVSDAERAATAQNVRGLRESLVADLNTTFNGNALFAGTASNQTAYALVAGAWTYQGNSDTTRVEVERGRLVAVSIDGQSIVEGGDSIGLFTALDDLAAAIEAGDNAGVSDSIAALERAFDRAQRAQGLLGADQQGIDSAAARLSALKVAADARRSKLEDINLAEAAVRLNQANNAYSAALSAVSSAERQSLLDYLR